MLRISLPFQSGHITAMFRYDVGRYILRRNAHEGFHVRNVLVRICEVIYLSLTYPDSRDKLNEIGLRAEVHGIKYHIVRLPLALLMPRETFEKHLRNQGCDVQPVPSSGDASSVDGTDLQARSWNFFVFPQTPEGAKLSGLVRKLCVAFHQQGEMAAFQRMNPAPNIPFQELPTPPAQTIITFDAPGPKQPKYFDYRPHETRQFLPPVIDRMSQWSSDGRIPKS